MSSPSNAPAESAKDSKGNDGKVDGKASKGGGRRSRHLFHRRDRSRSKRSSSVDRSENTPLLADQSDHDDVEAQGVSTDRNHQDHHRDRRQSHRHKHHHSRERSRVRRCTDQMKSLFHTCAKHIKSWFAAIIRCLSRNCCIIILACILAAATIGLGIYFGFLAKSRSPPRTVGICLLPSCVHAASEILSNLDPNYEDIDPCDDFDKYVCGGWEEQHDLRPDQGDIFTGTLMVERSQMLLRHILESDSSLGLESSADTDNFNKLKDGYEACMNEDIIKQYGAKPLRSVIKKIEGVFPTTNAGSNRGVFPIFQNAEQKGIAFDRGNELTNAILYLMNIGVDALLSMGVSGDDRDPDSQAIFVNPLRRVGLPSNEYYNDTETVSAYKDTLTQVLPAFINNGLGNSTILKRGHHMAYVHLTNLVENLVEFEKKLADVSPPPEEQEDVTKYYNPMSLDDAHALLPQISISYIISSQAPKGFTTNRVIIGSPSYMKSLLRILSDTPKETVQAYMIWKTIQAYVSKVQDPILKPLERFNNKLQGKDPDATEERWRTCIRVADSGLGWILSRFFIEKAFSPEAKEFGDLIVSDIKDRFMVTLENTEWMSKEVRDKGIEKVKNIVQKIGYPTKSPDILDPKALKSYYESVDITNHTHFENTLHIQKFYADKEWSALGKPTDRDEWLMTASTVNAYYNPPGNEIVFPAGIMQSPVFYDPSVPQYLSYGAFGAVSGHELSHAFDSTGRHYDQTGNYTNWWDSSTVSAFQTRAQCFIDQYSNFTVPNPSVPSHPLHVNGRFTLGENIADAGGLRASFAAWKKREAENPSDLLPGLQDFRKEQLFFMSYAGWWCGKTRKEAAAQRVFQDPHAPKWARIRGTMDNSPEFKEAFGCPKREAKCELW